MKLLPFMAAMALASPMVAMATVAMEAQQASQSGQFAEPSAGAPGAHRQLFLVKYVLRPASSGTPPIVFDDASPHVVPPEKGFPSSMLGALQQDPNKIICHGWGCQRRP